MYLWQYIFIQQPLLIKSKATVAFARLFSLFSWHLEGEIKTSTLCFIKRLQMPLSLTGYLRF